MAVGDEWKVFRYEWNMARLLLVYLQPEKHKCLEETLQNAVVECLVLHTRILVGILISDGPRPDDIRLKDLIQDFASTDVELLRKAYGAGNGSPRWQFNKLLAHATSHRTESHDYVDAIKAVWPHIQKIMHDIKLQNPPIDLE